jgi:membrane-bound serine protease (ClpP class)
MMQLAIILLVVGVLAIALEIMMPGFDGFVSGILGILALIASAVVAIIADDTMWMLVAVNLGVLLCACIIMYYFFRRKKLHGKIVLGEALAEDVPFVDLSALVGVSGKTTTILRPYGEAEFEGKRVEVTSGGPMIQPGTAVVVVERQATKLLVKEVI